MKSFLLLSVGLGVLGLSACSSTTPTVIIDPISTTTRTAVEQLAGTWTTNFTLDTPFSDRIQLSTIHTDPEDPTDFYISGSNRAGLLAIAWYKPESKTYVISVGNDEIVQFYDFKAIAADGRVAGTTWFAFEKSSSPDYAFTGQRTLNTASLRAQQPTAQVQRLFEKFKAAQR